MKKEIVLITGASRGIGKATAELFAQHGYPVAIGYHTAQSKAEALLYNLRTMSANVIAVQADIADQRDVHRMADTVRKELGPIGVLVNNAGIAQQKLFQDISEAEWDRIFDVNVKGAYHCIQSVLPDMIHQKHGVIINLSSIWGIVGASCEVHYSASKAAMIGMTKALAKELGPSGIRVNCVAPGVVDTEMNASLGEDTLAMLKEETPLGTLGSAEDIAETIYFLCSSKARFITGQVISPNGGFVI